MDTDKQIDESWKESAESEKEILVGQTDAPQGEPELHIPESIKEDEEESGAAQETAGEVPEVNFLNYITSLGFQAMIFLGEIPNPVTQKDDTNFDQAKFLIDTLSLLKDKTQGNLTKEEENLLNASVYELQMKYVEKIQAETAS